MYDDGGGHGSHEDMELNTCINKHMYDDDGGHGLHEDMMADETYG